MSDWVGDLLLATNSALSKVIEFGMLKNVFY